MRTINYVYRCYDAEGQLLYIGMTHGVNLRMRDHRYSRRPHSVYLTQHVVSVTSEEYPTREAAYAAEQAAIVAEKPLLNRPERRRAVA